MREDCPLWFHTDAAGPVVDRPINPPTTSYTIPVALYTLGVWQRFPDTADQPELDEVID